MWEEYEGLWIATAPLSGKGVIASGKTKKKVKLILKEKGIDCYMLIKIPKTKYKNQD